MPFVYFYVYVYVVKLHSNLQTQLNFSWLEKELTLFSYEGTSPRQPLHISPATLAHLPGNLAHLPGNPEPSPKLFPLTFHPLIGIKLYKMLNRLEFNFLVR